MRPAEIVPNNQPAANGQVVLRFAHAASGRTWLAQQRAAYLQNQQRQLDAQAQQQREAQFRQNMADESARADKQVQDMMRDYKGDQKARLDAIIGGGIAAHAPVQTQEPEADADGWPGPTPESMREASAMTS